MKISTKGRYGLMLLVDLAANESSGEAISLKTIAERQGLSDHYLEQLITPLRNAGMVRSVRGARGGYVLERSSAEILVSEVLATLEGPVTLVDEEFDDGLSDFWDRLKASILAVLESTTLQDLVEIREKSIGNFMYYI